MQQDIQPILRTAPITPPGMPKRSPTGRHSADELDGVVIKFCGLVRFEWCAFIASSPCRRDRIPHPGVECVQRHHEDPAFVAARSTAPADHAAHRREVDHVVRGVYAAPEKTSLDKGASWREIGPDFPPLADWVSFQHSSMKGGRRTRGRLSTASAKLF